MECTWDAALLQNELPEELLDCIRRNADHREYLEALTRTTLDARYTHEILAHCEDILAELCASLRSHASFATSIATLGRIVPFASWLAPFAIRLLDAEHHPLGDDEEQDALYLLGLFRLLRTDRCTFRRYIRESELTNCLGRGSRLVAYLAIRILQIGLYAADHWLETTIQRHLGDDVAHAAINGEWDGKMIDYRFLSLWEEHREEVVRDLISQARESRPRADRLRIIPLEFFHSSTSLLGNVIFPVSTAQNESTHKSSLVQTDTISQNLRSIAQALKTSAPLLISGVAGSGKTLLVRYAAEKLSKLDSMVTLHLNEQSDAKMLLGIYTTGDTPGSFTWKPGVLTTAVREGRWVLIEDLDKAPTEVLGTLLPLIEKRRLMIPSRKETLHAAQDFRIIATVRNAVNHRGEETEALVNMLGSRHWNNVHLTMPTLAEHHIIVRTLFPTLEKLLPQFIAAYERIAALRQQSLNQNQNRTGIARPISPRDLLKWCQRVAKLLQTRSSFTSSEVDAVFLEATDCFAGALPDGVLWAEIAGIIAEVLHIDPQRRDYLQYTRDVQYQADQDRLVIGRYQLSRSPSIKGSSSFSTNPHTTRMLERVTAAVSNQEPLLLVGETGVGKTTAVQHLANHLGKKLVPFNLSQQSEAGDLLGGFKPVNARTLMTPMKDRFDDLFAQSFSLSKNKKFLDQLGQQMVKGNWQGVCKYWMASMKMVDQQRAASPPRDGEAPTKKRKTETQRMIDFAAWDTFRGEVESLQHRLGSGGDTFAFAFMEGNIVKAVRNGDWVLLDEINLASPDTLESIADLLDPDAPSLLLTEAGNIERIKAHTDFRVFAAMNPATDVGKKDLPPGVRSRFTELYVESPDKDLKSLQSIVRSYLRQESAADTAIASDVSKLYQSILGLAEQNKLVDGAGQKPHFSLRTLTRTLSYAKITQQSCNLRRALYEGFQMSFLTFLDTESATLVQPLIEKFLFTKRTNVKSELKKALQFPHDNHEYVRGHPGSKHWIRKGTSAIQEQAHYIITPFVERNLENLVRAVSTRQFPVLIQGPTSAGKTSMIEYLAKRTGHKFTRINNHEHTDLQEYLGTYVSGTDGRLQFQEGVLVKALREGDWIVLDELNLAPTDVLEALNRLLDDNRELLIPETQEVIRPHPDFVLFATQNPAGLYGGRKTLSRAFRNRFLELHFDDIPVDELQTILERRTQLPKSRCERVVSVYRELSVLRQENRLFEQKSFATLRDLFRWALRPNDTIEQLAENGYMLLCERVRKPEERAALKRVIEEVMNKKGPKVRIDEATLYVGNCPEIVQYQRNASDQGVVWTKAMRRLYILVSRAIANNEPVLLVGETGCGKTTVCQMLSDALKKTLHMVNAHQNTETGDLIGSQRPVRNRAAIEATLRSRLYSSLACSLNDENMDEHNTDSLLSAYDAELARMDAVERATHLQTATHLEIMSLRTRFKALFEWVDGSLVQAMRAGELFLLDEISLADDSVLERLNSVLEPSRSILLAEKGALDPLVTAASDFQFFATMNPGGDYGKRELSPALRNRFTEIWVPAMSDMDDIAQIVQSKLADPAQCYAVAMIAFAGWFKSRYDTSASSSVSIRDTLAWVHFVNAFAQAGPVPAVVHGAAMVYIDTLGANPAGLMTTTSQSLSLERAACVQELGRLMNVDAASIYGQSLTTHNNEASFGIGPFTLSRLPGAATKDASFTFDPPTTKINAMRVLRALQLPKPVLLEGSPGVGKTTLVGAISAAVGMPLTRINLSDQTDLLDLFGSDAPTEGAATGTFMWRDAPFLRAMKLGEWVLLDEMNLASQSVLEGLNACLDHRGEIFVPELGQTFSRHPNFRLFAAQNPHHQGGGRKGLPASFVNRFTVVYADSFAAEDLNIICRRIYPSADHTDVAQAVAFVSKINEEVAERRSFGANGGPWEFNLRDVSRWLTLATSKDGLLKSATPKDFVAMLFSQRFRSLSDRNYVDEIFSSIFKGPQAVADMICNASSTMLQVGLALLPRDASKAAPHDYSRAGPASVEHWRAVETTMLCVHNSWPTILTGPSGSGKTTVIETLAAAVGADVVSLGISAETDTLDLIGGYEQYDPHRRMAAAAKELCSRIEVHVKATLAQGLVREATRLSDALAIVQRDMSRVEELANALSEELRNEMKDLLHTLQTTEAVIDQARFEWIDGPLIEAMQRGDWLVLDNANLCSPSVLDRLNGLMEPDGVLVVNENSASDGNARIIRPHPAFRIFLTVDPRFKDLSRAMRNRAVEIYLPRADRTTAAASVLHLESSMIRFRNFRVARQLNNCDQASSLMQDHLSFADDFLAESFAKQLEIGLYGSFSGRVGHALSRGADPRLATESRAQSISLYSDSANALKAPADFAHAQTFHPLNNQPLVQSSQQSFNKALALTAHYELVVSFSTVAAAFRTLRNDRKISERLARFWKSARQQVKSCGKTGPINVSEKLMESVQYGIQQISSTSTDLQPRLKKALDALLAYCWVFVGVLSSEALELPVLTASAFVGQSLCGKHLCHLPNDSSLEQFLANLADLGLASDPESRQVFVAVWHALLMNMPTTMKNLEARLNFEAVVAQFDELTSTFRLPVTKVIDLRVAFQRSLGLYTKPESGFDTLVQDVKEAMPTPPPNIEEVDNAVQPKPHFALSFELLCQHFAILLAADSSVIGHTESVTMEVLAGRKTGDGLLCSKGLRSNSTMDVMRLLRLSFCPAALIGSDATSDDSISIGGGVLRDILEITSSSLKSLALLETEVKSMGHIIASKAHLVQRGRLQALDKALGDLVKWILSTLANATEGGMLVQHARALLQLIEEPNVESLFNGNLSAHNAADPQMASTGHQLARVLEYCRKTSQSPSIDEAEAATAWMTFAMACLKLYVPETLFDPVQESHLQAAIHQRTKSYLDSRLVAVRSFRQSLFGESDSLRARLVQQEIEDLGQGPRIVEVCRPAQSQLTQLQGELQALRRILKPLLDHDGPKSPHILDRNSWSNLHVIRSRLADHYHAYSDLAHPVVGFIDCLFVSRRLATSARSSQASFGESTLAQLTPLIAATMKDWLSDAMFIKGQQSCRSMQDHIQWLSTLAARTAIAPQLKLSAADTRTAVERTLNIFYEAWKTELSRDQKSAAASSSLYQYRGVDDDSEEATAEQLEELFPSYHDPASRTATDASRKLGAQDMAPKMAQLYHALYRGTIIDSDQLFDLLQQAYLLPSISHRDDTPVIISMLHKLSEQLAETAPRSRNIYSEPDLSQSRTLIALLRQVQDRFEAIHNSWPEHAVPIDVLRVCESILSMPHAEPLARFFQPVEKLHAAINEWQKVASSEYSAYGLLEEITNLLISWRQLELSTWAGLFEHEDKAAKESAASWWYIAYETIVCAAESEAETSACLQGFAHQLLETLGGFLNSCGMGEFSLRLSMVRDFEADMRLRVVDTPALAPVQHSLSSLISYYAHFESAVSQAFATKRTALERQVKDVVQLASWKDRNILTLSQSAKASHKRLFRLVRKYRNLLSEPVGTLLHGDFPATAIDHSDIKVTLSPAVAALTNGDLPASVARHWKEVQELPLIIQELNSQAQSHEILSKSPARIVKFLTELDEETNELRKATPKTTSEENKSLIQHLKTRKRRLLADVLRDLRLMGFQANISDSVLAEQSSLHAVLTRSQPISRTAQVVDGATADYSFYRLAHTMTSVRDSAVKHSEDLTPAEISRSKALLESMFRTAIDQRDVLSRELADFAKIETALHQLSVLLSCEDIGVSVSSDPAGDLLSKSAILGSILDACGRLIRWQAELASTDFTHVISSIDAAATALRDIKGVLPPGGLPQHLDDKALANARAAYDRIVRTLSQQIVDHGLQHHELTPVLSQLTQWLDVGADVKAPSQAAQSLDEWSNMLFRVISQIQRAGKGPRPPEGYNKKAWLVEDQRRICDGLLNLGMSAVSDKISYVLLSVSHVGDSLVLAKAVELCRAAQPVLQAYAQCAQQMLERACALHTATCNLAHRLSLSFIQLARQGFCQPPEKAEDEEQQSGQVESGTGLGDGEGGEDISKDVGADEDLSELAQDAASKDKNEETQAEKDAVDMADEDLEGDFDEDAGSEAEAEEENKEDQEDGDLDEETGHVDQDDNAVDEKTWDDGKSAKNAEKEAEKGKGSRNDDMAAAENAESGVENEQQEGAEEDEQEAEAEDDAGFNQQETEEADPHMQEEQNLDLPDDMDMDGEHKDISDVSDAGDDMDAVADVDDPDNQEAIKDDAKDLDVQMGEEEADEEQEECGEATTEGDQERDDHGEDDTQQDTAMLDDKPDFEAEATDALVSADGGQGHEEDPAKMEGVASTIEQEDNNQDTEQPSDRSGAAEGTNRTQGNEASGQAEPGAEDQQSLPFKQLGDILKQHYNQHRPIEAAQEPDKTEEAPGNDADMNDPRFEHLPEDADTDMQAIGAANAADSRALDEENAIDVNSTAPDDLPLPTENQDPDPKDDSAEDIESANANGETADSGPKRNETVIGKAIDDDVEMNELDQEDNPDDVEEVDEQLTNTHLSQQVQDAMSIEDARQAWTQHESRTRNMAIILTEHLRLILQPTQATKMRGDFRTGKRLNIKKIIPYIASSYKRDKIWMRRSIPSKRSYQVMLAIDDSQSMNEDERKDVAFDTLALVAKSMSMLEVGEIGILGFGQEVNVAHDFSLPFTTDAGAEVRRQFSFSQTKTDVRKLLQRSIELFQDARLRATGAATDLWQIQLIISDGLCEDHAGIRQLVRQAHEERIMVVFIVVDTAAPATGAAAKSPPKQSILDLNEAKFAIGPNGEPDVQMVRYLDTFPFRYYLIVRDVQELPNVLAGALRQWFSEVVDTGA